MSDPFDLQRFVDAQRPVYPRALGELEQGRKTTHWMWFVFPQLAGLGFSSMAQRFAISGLDEARAYLADPVLGARLVECVETVMRLDGRSALEIFGQPDDLKFRSSLTLFAAAAPDEPVFAAALDKYFAGQGDALTLERLGG